MGMSKSKVKAKQIYERNKRYVEANINKLGWRELSQYARTQDLLYNYFTGSSTAVYAPNIGVGDPSN